MTTTHPVPTLRVESELDWRGGRTVAGDGTSLSHLTIGDGPTVLIVPGGLAQAAQWAHIARALADVYRVVVMDRRNAGASGWSDRVGVDVEADDVLAVLDDVGPAAVVGHSYGASVALEAARRATASVERLVLYEPALPLGGPVIDGDTLDHWRDLTASGRYAEVVSEFYAPPVSALASISPAELEMLRSTPQFDLVWAMLVAEAPVIEPTLRSVAMLDDPERYRAVEVPTRLLLGTESAEHPFRDTVAILARTLPHASVGDLAGQRHLAFMLAPDLVIEAIREFVPS
jgi:pimeloyl-ACP methyl ester carboxylesterase